MHVLLTGGRQAAPPQETRCRITCDPFCLTPPLLHPAGLLETAHLTDGLERVDASTLTLEQFVERYERPRRPVMITGLCGGWRAAQEWTPDRLLERLGECKFKVGAGREVFLTGAALKCHCLHAREQVQGGC